MFTVVQFTGKTPLHFVKLEKPEHITWCVDPTGARWFATREECQDWHNKLGSLPRVFRQDLRIHEDGQPYEIPNYNPEQRFSANLNR